MPGSGSVQTELRLPYRAPMELAATLEYLGRRAIAGIEELAAGCYRRSVALPGGPALLTVAGQDLDHHTVRVELRLSATADLEPARQLIGRLLDLDADPVAVDATLARLPSIAALVARRAGLRSPGAADGFEMAMRAIVGQQISVAGARTVLGRLVTEYGRPGLAGEPGWRLFPQPAVLAALDPATLPMPRARGRTVVGLAAAVAAGDLDLTAAADRASTRVRLLAIAGIGPWTADYLLMRALGDRDVFLATDLGVRHALARLPDNGAGVIAGAAQAAPWRSYLTHQLWASLSDTPAG